MNKFTQKLIWAMLLLCSQVIVAQQDYDILLQTVTIDDMERQTDMQIVKYNLQQYQYDEQYYLILQFDSIPTFKLLKTLQDIGIELLGYLPNLAYWASIPIDVDLNTLPVRKIIFPKPHYKLTLQLYNDTFQPINSSSTLLLQIFPFSNISTEQLSIKLTKEGYAIEKINARYIQLRLHRDQLISLAAYPAVMYLETTPPEPSPEDILARSLHGIHPLSSDPGMGLDGTGVVLSTADDGIAVHPDLKNRVVSHLNTDDSRHHSDMVLGILTGAGNIDQTASGMAPGATVHLYDILTYDHIEQAVPNFETYRTTITTTAYAEGCGGNYGGSARDIDDQVYQNPFLLHCFSTGNEADEPCSDVYGHLLDNQKYSFGNITGGRKAAKNVITVGNLHYNDRLMTLSSRGPANDGRIKPDLCAYGQGQRSIYPDYSYRAAGGSSAAVPVVAGAAALLTQLYKEQRQSDTITIPSDLLKPILLNTTEDLGARGPDFKYGWGRLQIQRAAEILLQNHYLKAGIAHRQENVHQINIPADALDLRIMLYWHDPAANPAAGKALVNDLDLVVEPPTGSPIRPWVLSTAAHIDSINKPAYRGVDRINNVEQVGIDFPLEGNYQIRVKGHLVPEGPQLYYIVYSYRRKALNITYPIGGESFSPDENQVIRWDAFGLHTPINLEYKLEGQPWETIATNLSPQLRHFNWNVPDEIHGLAQIRIRSGNQQDISPTPFSILGQPKFNFLYETNQTAWIQWTPVEGADSYDVFMLGERYMKQIGSTSGNSFRIQTDSGKINWYSVRARKNDGTIGRRALAKRYLNLACETNINIKFQFDAFPSEIQWQLRDQANIVIAKGGPYKEQDPHSLMEITTCVPLGCYALTIMDSYGDGLCCSGGQGYYELTDEDGQILASGSTFVHEDKTNFCLDSLNSPPPIEPLSIRILDYQNVSCYDDTDGEVLIQANGGRGNYNYHWSNGQNNSKLQNVRAGNYQITVTDGFSAVTKQIQVHEPTRLVINLEVTSDHCQQNTLGEISATTLGGTPPYEYAWNNGSSSPSITGLSAGQYSLTVTDSNGCETIRSTTLESITDMELSLEAYQPDCTESANGQIFTNLTGGHPPFQYHWSTGHSSASINQLSPGTYTLTVTDASGCQVLAETTLLDLTPISIEATLIAYTDTHFGSIHLQVSGGMPGYRYRWSDGKTSVNRFGLSAGTYSVTVTDNKNCSQNRTFIVPDESTDTAPSYCSAFGSQTAQEWIERIEINDFLFPSGNNQGYKSHLEHPVNIAIGQSFNLKLETGKHTNSILHYWRVWIDFNQNGSLDDPGELVFQNELLQDAFDLQIPIPANINGQTLMRVAMRWGSPPASCGNIIWGEVEDFTLLFSQPESAPGEKTTRILPPNPVNHITPSLEVFPNPASDRIWLNYNHLPSEPGDLFLINGQGQRIKQWEWNGEGASGVRQISLSSQLEPGIYHLYLRIGQWYDVKRLVVQ